jgi:alpha-tubulin suppressor-like RCC1 family protein
VPPARRLTAAVAAGLTTLLGLTGCTAADRAVLAAPSCRDVPGAPARTEPIAGTVYAWQPHFRVADAASPEIGADAPEAVPGWTDVVSLASTGHTTYAVRAGGTVEAYGLGHHGSLGDGDPGRHAVAAPQPVPGITDARSVHVVGSAALVVRADGTVLVWGDGLIAHAGALDTRHDHAASPVPIDGLADVHSIADGDLTALALRTDGTVAGWGTNLTDVLGERDGTALRTVADVSGVVSLALAGAAVVAARGDGSVCAWGNNVHGLLGVTPTGGQTGRPVAVEGLVDIEQVAGGSDVAYARDRNGAVWAWGRGVSGALGDGRADDHVAAVPARVEGLPRARWIGSSGLTGFAVDVDGALWAWGSGAAIGRYSAGAALTPVRIPLPGPVLAVSGSHALIGTPGVAL